jgi:hypothetical protein
VGLVLGGVLTEYASWRWCLLVNVPIAIVAIAAAVPIIKESKAHGNTRYDVPGAILVALGLGSLVFGFAQAENGWSSWQVLVFIPLGVLMLALFVLVESRSNHPLLPLRILADKVRGGAFITGTLTGAALLGGLLFLTFHLQIVLGFSPLESGLASLPMTVGPVAVAAGLLYLSRITVGGSYAVEVLPGLLLMGLGLAMIFVPLQNVDFAGIDAHDAGAASAAVTAVQQIGGSIGSAVFTVLYTSAVAASLAGGDGTPVAQLQAFVDGYQAAFFWAAVGVFLAAPVA